MSNHWEFIIRDKLPKIKAAIENILSPLERVAKAQRQDPIGDGSVGDGLDSK